MFTLRRIASGAYRVPRDPIVPAMAVHVWTAVILGLSSSAAAGPLEVVGTRALGMAGAFVAVADDPSAAYWNPAGFSTAGFFGGQFDLEWLRLPRGDAVDSTSGPLAAGSWLVAVGTPPLAASYYHLSEAGRNPRAIVPAVVGATGLARLDVHNVGVTLLQSLSDGLTVGATLKYLRGTAGTGGTISTNASEIRDRARDLEGRSSNAGDVDVGLHGVFGRWRFGLLGRNLFEPSFAAPSGEELTMGRQIRIGGAVDAGGNWTIAADADLLKPLSATGRWRRAAVGVEHWQEDRRFGVRGGVRFNTLEDANPAVAAGASLALRSGLYLEGQATIGSDDAEQAWGVSVRFTY